MSDQEQPGTPPHEPVGSVGEEAAKLFGALSDWAREQSQEAGPEAGAGAAFGQAAQSAREAFDAGLGRLEDLGEHVAHGGEDCRYCPVCQVIRVVRQTSPEVRAHLGAAASSLMQAAAGLLETQPPPRDPVERIDLDLDPDADDEPRGPRP